MKKYVVFIKHIHSCFASASSCDKWLYKVVPEHENKIKLEVGQSAPNSQLFEKTMPGVEVIEEIDKEDKFVTNVYFEADKTFYRHERGKGHQEFHTTPAFKELIEKYVKLGWSDKRPAVEDERYARMDKKHIQDRKKAGLVLWKKYDERKPEDYKGGFSTEFFNVPRLQKYIQDGCVYGYIGHSARTHHTDRCIEKTLRALGLPLEQLSLYLTSSDGRHFGDSLEDLSPEEQETKISDYSPHFYSSIIKYSQE